MTAIVCLDDIEPDDFEQVGGKAFSLGRMKTSDLPVPDGFCVKTGALGSLDHPSLAQALRDEIETACQSLGLNRVAVRSSALREDGATTSFAGQQETFLGVNGINDIWKSIEDCRLSKSSERLYAYQQHHGIHGESQSIAVIVQRMIPAEVAGVIFTRNPLDPLKDEMLIEASWGLGEMIVSGHVTPDRWSVDRVNGSVNSQQIARKTRAMTIDGIVDVPHDRQDQPSLSHEQLGELVGVAHRVEELFGDARDIEWAYSDGRFWLLQARPITTTGVENIEAIRIDEIARLKSLASTRGTIWSRFNLSEVLTLPTPMTWSIVKRLMSGRGGFGMVYRDLGFDPDPELDELGIFDLAFGRPYCNLDREPRLYYRNLPLGHSFAELKADPRKALFPQPSLDPTRLDWRFWRRLPLLLPRLLSQTIIAEQRRRELFKTFEQRFRTETVPRFLQDVESAAAEDLNSLDDMVVWERCLFWQVRTLIEFARESLKPAALASLALGHLEQRLTRSMGFERGSQAARELIMKVNLDEEADIARAWRQMVSGQLSEELFLKQFGHRGSQEMELSEPRWHERPRAGIRVPGERLNLSVGDIEANSCEEFEGIWQRITTEAKVSLNDRLKQSVTDLRAMIRLRETAKHHFMRGYGLIRRYLCELGRRFELGTEIFELTTEEIPRLLNGERFDSTITSRRRRRQLLSRIHVPSVIFSDELDSVGKTEIPGGTHSFLGTPISAGTAQGPALVLETPIHADVEPGYILVCPSTDPDWVPLFAHAAGLIMETGGVLSHGAIVAREFGVPAVAGISDIMRQVKTGQRLRIDGKTGFVHLVFDDAPDGPQ